MDARELLVSWPGLDRLKAAEILARPAWRMSVGYEDEGLSLVLDSELHPDELFLAIPLDDVENVLGISDSPAYPDLHRLWARRAELPDALIVALVEKEVGTLLQAVEKASHKELRIAGLTSAAGNARHSFRLETPDGVLGFSLRLPSDVVTAIGVLDNLDPSHASIQSMTRSAQAEYAVIDVSPDVVSSLKPGDFLLAECETSASWQTELPDDSSLRLRGEADESFTFAQFVSGALPPVPSPASFAVYCHGRKVATAVVSSVGDSPAFKITTLC